MIRQWQNAGRPLPDDDQKLARISRLTLSRWKKKVRLAIEKYFDIRDGTWSQKEVAEKFRKNRISGARGGRAKARKVKERALASATNSPTDPPGLAKHQNSSDCLPNYKSEGRRILPSPKEERENPSSVPGNSAELESDTPRDGNDGKSLQEGRRPKSSTIDADDNAAHTLFDGPRPSDNEIAAWNQALLTLRVRTEGMDYKHLHPLELVAVDGNRVTFSAPTVLVRDRASELSGRIRDALQDAGLAIGIVHIEVADRFARG